MEMNAEPIRVEAEDGDVDVGVEEGRLHSPQTMVTIKTHEAPLAARIDHLHRREEDRILAATVHAHLTEAADTIHTTTGRQMDITPIKDMAVVIEMLVQHTDKPTHRPNHQVSSFYPCRPHMLTTKLQRFKNSSITGDDMLHAYGAAIGDTHSLTVFVHNLNNLLVCAPKLCTWSHRKMRPTSLRVCNLSMCRSNQLLSRLGGKDRCAEAQPMACKEEEVFLLVAVAEEALSNPIIDSNITVVVSISHLSDFMA
jgi:hypothetical protein